MEADASAPLMPTSICAESDRVSVGMVANSPPVPKNPE
jgi:hypothetical protein